MIDSRRWAGWVSTIALVAVFGGGVACRKDDSAKPSSSSGTAQGSATGASGKTGAKPINWEKVERVPFAKLQTLLPESLGALKRGEMSGSINPAGEHTNSIAAVDYSGAEDVNVRVELQDNPVLARELLSDKTTTFDGYPVIGESAADGGYELRFIVGDRFIVVANGTKRSGAELKEALKLIDFAKLASWKSEGVPKN